MIHTVGSQIKKKFVIVFCRHCVSRLFINTLAYLWTCILPFNRDEEYDTGKRKKIRDLKQSFDGPNLFQQIAIEKSNFKRARLDQSKSTEKSKFKRARMDHSGNPPFRIWVSFCHLGFVAITYVKCWILFFFWYKSCLLDHIVFGTKLQRVGFPVEHFSFQTTIITMFMKWKMKPFCISVVASILFMSFVFVTSAK